MKKRVGAFGVNTVLEAFLAVPTVPFIRSGLLIFYDNKTSVELQTSTGVTVEIK